MVSLLVHELDKDEVFQDIVKVHYSHRKGAYAGQIICLRAKGVPVLAAARGAPNNDTGGIWLSSAMIGRLGLERGKKTDFEINKARWDQQFAWLWRATDPANRTAGRLGIISFILGLIGLFLGLMSLFR